MNTKGSIIYIEPI